MPTLTSAGIGSGLDIDAMVKGLTKAEISPLRQKLYQDKGETMSKISSLGKVLGAVSGFESSVDRLSALSSKLKSNIENDNSEFYDVTASGKVEGSFDIEVAQLSKNAKISSQGFNDKSATIGSGTVSIKLGDYSSGQFVETPDSSFTIDISENSSLEDIRNKINEVAGDKVNANVIFDGSQNILMITSKESGVKNDLKIDVLDDDGDNEDSSGLSFLKFDKSGSSNMTQNQAPQNSKIILDGVPIESPNRIFDKAIEGLSIEVKKTTEAVSSFSSSLDKGSIKGKINTFVGSFNAMVDEIKNATKYDQETGERGPLVGEFGIRDVMFKTTASITSPIKNPLNEKYNTLYSVGIRLGDGGKLEFDDKVFDEAIKEDFKAVMAVFSGTVSNNSDNRYTPIVDLKKYKGEETSVDVKTITAPVSSTVKIDGNSQLSDVLSGSSDIDISAGSSISFKVGDFDSGIINLIEGTYNKDDFITMLSNQIANSDNVKKSSLKIKVFDDGSSLFFKDDSEVFRSIDTMKITNVEGSLKTTYGVDATVGSSVINSEVELNGKYLLGNGTLITGEDSLEGVKMEISKDTNIGNLNKLHISRGVSNNLLTLLNSFIGDSGFLSNKEKNYKDLEKSFIDKKAELDKKEARIEEMYRKQFNALDSQIASLKSQGNYFLSALQK